MTSFGPDFLNIIMVKKL